MLDETLAGTSRKAEAFLRALAADPHEPIPAARIAVIVAHPDDETIGIGGQLGRLGDVTVVHVTDGAPRQNGAAQDHGFADVAAYAAARREELRAAMALAGVPDTALVSLGVADQEASLHLPDIARQLAALCRERRLDLLVTHAYEGGHPDHDATALGVHAAAALLHGELAPAVIEMPLYHLGDTGWTVQRFAAAEGLPETEVSLSDEQRRQKRAMLDAHATQRGVLSMVAIEIERFRPAPAYDFSALPNEGRLLYERHGWGMAGAQWQALAAAALRDLGLGVIL